MDITSIVFMVIALLVTAFAIFAIVSAIRGVSYITLPEPAKGEPQLGYISQLQQKLTIHNKN